MSIISRIGAWFRKMFSKQTLEQALGDIKLDATSQEMLSAQQLWYDIYTDNAPWLFKDGTRVMQSANLGATISAEASRQITIEMKSVIMVADSDENEMNAVYQSEVMRTIREKVDKALGLGGCVWKPYKVKDRIKIDFNTPQDFVVTGFDSSGNVSGIVFIDTFTNNKNQHFYTRLEMHDFNEFDSTYVIQNKAYVSSDTNDIGREVPLASVDRWQGISKRTKFTNITQPLFGYFRPATANNVDPKSPLGVSIFHKAIESIRRCDEQITGLRREFKVKEAKQYIDEAAMPTDGTPLPYLQEDYYIKLSQSDAFFESYSPEIYEESYIAALNEYKRSIEDNVGLARGALSEAQDLARTATELQIVRQRTAALITDNQNALTFALKSLVYAMFVMKHAPGIVPEYDISFDYDDSLIVDKETERINALEEVGAGLLRPEEFRMRVYGETEEQAKERLPGMEVLMRAD